MNGPPVSTWASRIAYHSFWAGIDLRARPSFSYFSYRASNSALWTSCKPGASLGQKRDHSPFASTRFMLRTVEYYCKIKE
jgi:hypothetical protein